MEDDETLAPRAIPASSAAPDGSALALVRLPFSFTQDSLWTSDEFIRQAKRRGVAVDLHTLELLHQSRLLLPLFRVSDTASVGRRITINTGEPVGLNPRGWIMQAASDGRLRDPADEGFSAAWPYERPEDELDRRWWSGFVYSSWQLLELATAIADLEWGEKGLAGPELLRRAESRRRRTQALSALSGRHLASIRGQITVPAGLAFEGFDEARFAAGVGARLTVAGYSPERLRPNAESLLLEAHGDPLIRWWPLIRHAGHEGWDKMDGEPANHLWARIGAEVLLRAHEELVADGVAEPLPDPRSAGAWSPLLDRVSSSPLTGGSLERSLSAFGLSPHPKVLLLVEGQTEMTHIPRLFDLFGLNRPHLVRVQNCRGADVNPQLISRYAIAPRLAEKRGNLQLLETHPTCLLIAMDPESRWATEARRDKERRRLQRAIAEEVSAQGGAIGQYDLDWLVSVFVWGEDTYELANFSDDELTEALLTIGREQSREATNLRTDRVRDAVQFARAGHRDISKAFQRLELRENKPRLAELLWPTLRDRFEQELATGDVNTPVFVLVNDVRHRVTLNLRTEHSLAPLGPSPSSNHEPA